MGLAQFVERRHPSDRGDNVPSPRALDPRADIPDERPFDTAIESCKQPPAGVNPVPDRAGLGRLGGRNTLLRRTRGRANPRVQVESWRSEHAFQAGAATSRHPPGRPLVETLTVDAPVPDDLRVPDLLAVVGANRDHGIVPHVTSD